MFKFLFNYSNYCYTYYVYLFCFFHFHCFTCAVVSHIALNLLNKQHMTNTIYQINTSSFKWIKHPSLTLQLLLSNHCLCNLKPSVLILNQFCCIVSGVFVLCHLQLGVPCWRRLRSHRMDNLGFVLWFFIVGIAIRVFLLFCVFGLF